MEQSSFKHVTETGYRALADEFNQGAWATVDITPFVDAQGAIVKPLCTALVTVKIEILATIASLASARSSVYSATDLNRIWDNFQRQLNLTLSTAATDPDAHKRAAALRLQKLLLRGGGTGQTSLKYQQEIDFGREQIKAAAKDEAAKDIALLAIDSLMASIGTATENLAEAIGHGGTDQRPSEQVRGAKAECAAACIWAVHTLTRLGNRGTVAGDRELAVKLVDTLLTLAARYPAPSKKDTVVTTGTTGTVGTSTPTTATGPTKPTGTDRTGP